MTGERILLVEDEAIIALDEKLTLEREGYSVEWVASGKAALAAVTGAERTYDLVLMDIHLGEGMDGAETAKQVLAISPTPILFLTSHTEKEIVEKTEAIGSYGYVVKGSGMDVVLASIRVAFRLHAANCNILEQKKQIEAANQALRTSEDRYRNLVQNANEAIYIVQDYRIRFANEQCARLTGLKTEELVGRSVFDFVIEEQSNLLVQHHQALISGNRDQDTIELMAIFQGQTHWLYINSVRILWAEKPATLNFASDISERKRAEAAFAESERRLSMFVTAAREGVWAMDGDFVTTYVNPHMAEMLGYSVDEMVGRRVDEFMFLEDLSDHNSHMNARQRGVAERYERRFRRKDGGEVWTIVSAAPLLSQGSQFAGSFAMFTDITERRRMEQALSDSETRYRQVFETSQDALFIIGEDGRFLDANSTAIARYGYSLEEFTLMTPAELAAPDISGAAMGQVRQALDNSIMFEWRHRCKDGRELPVEISTRPIRIGGRRCTVAEARDITERKLATAALQNMLREKELFLRELQHRVKNNLNMVSSLLALEMYQVGDERLKRVFYDTQARIRSMSAIYEQLYRAGSIDQVDLDIYISNLVRLIESSYSPADRRVTITARLQPYNLDLKRAAPLGLALNELLTNALRHAYPPPAGGEVSVSLRVDCGRLAVVVADDGVGLPPDANASQEGMGLKLVEILANQIGADFKLQSGGEAGKGVAARITLPI